ncbi:MULTISPECIES: VOC family protein [unclassified Psychrobacillus]|uniref:VOC family protein n=1 Tax=unclassified Psychrobacillus TaxID=2636677 RepID=UPI0011A55AC9|nr:VOC family protein [Bacillus sp. N3536]
MGTSLLNGVEGIFIPVKNPAVSAQWYETVLGFKLNYIEEEAAVMKISNNSPTVVCLVKVENYTPMKFPSNNFGVGKYVNFIPENIEKLYDELKNKGIAVKPLEGDEEKKYFTFFDPDGNPLGACQ